MAVPIPRIIREKIVFAYEKKLATAELLASIFDVNIRTVRALVKQYRETRNLEPAPLPGRPPKLTEENLEIMKRIVEKNPDKTLADYVDEFEKETGVIIGVTSAFNACQKIDLIRKKKASTRLSKKEKK